jgi:hypothetical protein
MNPVFNLDLWGAFDSRVYTKDWRSPQVVSQNSSVWTHIVDHALSPRPTAWIAEGIPILPRTQTAKVEHIVVGIGHLLCNDDKERSGSLLGA